MVDGGEEGGTLGNKEGNGGEKGKGKIRKKER